MHLKTTALILTLFAFSSCAPSLYDHNRTEVENAREHWVGESLKSLITTWGPPTKKSDDGDGGKILSYKRNNGYITWVTNFYINQDDTIYHLNAFSE